VLRATDQSAASYAREPDLTRVGLAGRRSLPQEGLLASASVAHDVRRALGRDRRSRARV